MCAYAHDLNTTRILLAREYGRQGFTGALEAADDQPHRQSGRRRPADGRRRLVDAFLVEINDQMIAAERRYIAASMAELTNNTYEPPLSAAPRT